jgi:hypothetical protein
MVTTTPLVPPKQEELRRQHISTKEVMSDYLGLPGSVLHGHGGYKTLWVSTDTRNKMWYSKLDGTAQKYIRRLCAVGKILESTYEIQKIPMDDYCYKIDALCQKKTGQKKTVSLAQLEKITKGDNWFV